MGTGQRYHNNRFSYANHDKWKGYKKVSDRECKIIKASYKAYDSIDKS